MFSNEQKKMLDVFGYKFVQDKNVWENDNNLVKNDDDTLSKLDLFDFTSYLLNVVKISHFAEVSAMSLGDDY